MFNILRRAFAVGALALGLAAGLAQAAQPPAYDVRAVIDVSGSMKQNDPKNLRVPAVRLLTSLLPPEAQAGVWTFGQATNMLVPMRPVTPAWQKQAAELANQIDYRGQFTHIGLALTKAAEGWGEPSPTTQRHIILLTDGVVDISKDPEVNRVERERVLAEVLPALQKTGVHIHSIALSADADAKLMQTLSTATDGIFVVVNNAEDLHRIFLKLFEQAAPRPTVPLNENRFNVDASIDEFTLLVMRKDGGEPSKLKDPAGKVYTADTLPAGGRWFADARYDLITVPKPLAGEWQVEAALDPDNRVMVVSKLGMKVNAVPAQVLAGETIPVRVDLLENDQVITREDFLSLVKLQLRNGEDLMDFSRVGAQFQVNWPVPPLDGRYEVLIDVQAPTFQRQQRLAVQVNASALKAEIKPVAEHPAHRELRVSLDTNLFKADSVTMRAAHQIPKAAQEVPLTLEAADAGYRALVNDETPGEHWITVQAEGVSLSGRPVKFAVDPLRWRVAEPEPEKKPEPVAAPAEVVAPEAKSGSSLWLWALLINGTVAILGGGIWWWTRWRHKRAKNLIADAFGEDGAAIVQAEGEGDAKPKDKKK